MRDIRSSEKQSEQKKSKETAEAQDSSVNLVTAAVRWEAAGDQETYSLLFRIQKLWRGYITRKYALRKREEELIFIGMVTSCHVCHV